MEKDKIINELYEAIECNGLIKTIKAVFGAGTKISLIYSEESGKMPIEKLNLSVRSNNCLKRVGFNTVDKVVEAMRANTLLQIRNLGKNSRAEINVRIYEFLYGELNELRKKEFVKKLLELNTKKRE